jgi:hypothetical protein
MLGEPGQETPLQTFHRLQHEVKQFMEDIAVAAKVCL